GGQGPAAVEGGDDGVVPVIEHVAHGERVGKRVEELTAAVGGAVVDHDEREALGALREALHAGAGERELVVDGHHERDPRRHGPTDATSSVPMYSRSASRHGRIPSPRASSFTLRSASERRGAGSGNRSDD